MIRQPIPDIQGGPKLPLTFGHPVGRQWNELNQWQLNPGDRPPAPPCTISYHFSVGGEYVQKKFRSGSIAKFSISEVADSNARICVQ